MQRVHELPKRLKYVYIRPGEVEDPNLILEFKKSDETVATKNMHKLVKVSQRFSSLFRYAFFISLGMMSAIKNFGYN